MPMLMLLLMRMRMRTLMLLLVLILIRTLRLILKLIATRIPILILILARLHRSALPWRQRYAEAAKLPQLGLGKGPKPQRRYTIPTTHRRYR